MALSRYFCFLHELISAQRLIQQEDTEGGLCGGHAILGDQVNQWENKTYSRTKRIIGAIFSRPSSRSHLLSRYIRFLSVGLMVGLACSFSLVVYLALSTLTKTKGTEVFTATAA